MIKKRNIHALLKSNWYFHTLFGFRDRAIRIQKFERSCIPNYSPFMLFWASYMNEILTLPGFPDLPCIFTIESNNFTNDYKFEIRINEYYKYTFQSDWSNKKKKKAKEKQNTKQNKNKTNKKQTNKQKNSFFKVFSFFITLCQKWL